jgi:hypothetical protein
MKCKLLSAVCSVALTVLLNCGSTAPSAAQAQSAPVAAIAKLPPEVRLRKLHLVRPDLIQYPILYEIYC